LFLGDDQCRKEGYAQNDYNVKNRPDPECWAAAFDVEHRLDIGVADYQSDQSRGPERCHYDSILGSRA
jgi:hypothetical protein